MDETERSTFHRTMRQLAEDGDLDSDARDKLDRLLALVPDDSLRDPASASRDGLLDRDRQHSSPPVAPTGSTSGFARKPTDLHRPPSYNPFHRPKSQRPDRISSSAAQRPKLDRFINLGLVGQGGMGEVYRVIDPELDRQMVLKVLRKEWVDDERSAARFLEEARLTSQLQHPGIVPVHELGILDDGRIFFTMREVRGRTLGEVIDEYHEEFDPTAEHERAWHAHFQGLIDIFARACEPVAYAHSRGVIHRDLKPSNIMVGDFGEVQILDWGLGKSIDAPERDAESRSRNAGPSHRRSGFSTHRGSIVGTPAFMPPEQARGRHRELGPPADVYALSTILFSVLQGERAFDGPNPATIIFQVIDGVDIRPGAELGAPDDLIDLCLRAMSVEAGDRPRDAGEFGAAIAEWREGSSRQKQAWELIDSADELIPEFEQLDAQAKNLRRESRRMLREVPRSAPVEKKRPAWSLQQEAELIEREASTHRARVVQYLETALTYVPDLEPAHDRLAALYRRDHAEAELQRDLSKADSLEVFIRAHNTGKFDDYLAGIGELTVRTRPSGARVEISRYVKQEHHLVAGLQRLMGHTPIVAADLPMGSYLLEFQASERAAVRYPVFITRQGVWTGAPPGDDATYEVALPFADELDSDEIYVPASSFWRGGDDRAFNGAPRSVRWVDPFIIQKFPVTHGDYLEFLNDLVRCGRTDRAERYCPKSAGNIGYKEGRSIYLRDDSGHYLPRPNDDDFVDLPVNLIDWHSARAYARWFRKKMGRPWRLPTSQEWEKAARGVDGRFFPWGDILDPTWCRMLHSTRERPRPAPVDSYPADESPYGVRGMAGNIRDWCIPDTVDDADDIDDDPVPARGGCWFSTPEMCRLASRDFSPATARSAGTGFRLVRSLD